MAKKDLIDKRYEAQAVAKSLQTFKPKIVKSKKAYSRKPRSQKNYF